MPALPSWVWILLGLLAALAGYVAVLPWVIQPLLRVLLWPRYRLVLQGREHLPRDGPAVLVMNHLSWFDGFFVAATCPRRGKALVYGMYIDVPILGYVARRAGLIPVYLSGASGQRKMIKACRDVIDRGEVLGIFAEGQISRNGLTGPFQRGLEVILAGREHVPVIPVYLDNVWGSLLSFSQGRFFKKKLQGLRRTVYIIYGPPVPPPIKAFDVRQAVLETGARASAKRGAPLRPLETIDPALPHLDHPTLGPLAGSTANYAVGDVRQTGNKPGTVGVALPGVALRVVGDSQTPLPPETEGRLQAITPTSRSGRHWLSGGSMRDGFVTPLGE